MEKHTGVIFVYPRCYSLDPHSIQFNYTMRAHLNLREVGNSKFQTCLTNLIKQNQVCKNGVYMYYRIKLIQKGPLVACVPNVKNDIIQNMMIWIVLGYFSFGKNTNL